MFKHIIFDIETNGLLDTCTTVHCIAIKCLDTGASKSFSDQPGYPPIGDCLQILQKARTLIGHNILKFDIPALEKIYNFSYKGKIYDTLIAARTAYPDLMPFDCTSALPTNMWGRHSLKAWGLRIGCLKGDYGEEKDAWDNWSKEMQEYCEQDVEVAFKLFQFLKEENIPAEALHIEHELGKYLFAQEQGGFPFNKQAAEKLVEQLAAEEEKCLQELKSYFGLWIKRGEYVIPKSNRGRIGDKKSTLFTIAKGCSYCKLEIMEYTGGPDQTKTALKRKYGWEPEIMKKRKKLKGEMQNVMEEEGTDEVTLSKLDFPCIPTLIKYNNVRKIRGMLEKGVNAWLRLYNEKTGCIHGQVTQNGTVTHRATHQRPNISQVPSAKRPYGKECRELFYAPEGYTIIGTDASGLELRMLAHYMYPYDNGAYANEILNGDIHTMNQKAAGLKTRNDAKTFIYACVPYDTQVLCKTKGWVTRNNLEIGDIILTYNSKNNQKEWQPVKNIVEYKNAEIIEMRHGHSFSVRSTPNHRWFVRQRKMSKTKPSNVETHWTVKGYRFYVNEVRTTETINTESEIICNARMSPDVEGNFEWSEEKYNVDWTLKVLQMTSQQRQAFLQGFLIADGYKNPQTNQWNWSQNVSELSEAALTASYLEHSGQLYVRESTKGGNIVGSKQMIVCNLSNRQHITGQKLEKIKHPNADVWCVQTDNESFVMRQGNCITITGNTLYGAGVEKMGSIVVPNGDSLEKIKKGTELKNNFYKALPALKELADRATEEAAEHGYVTSIDGRKTYVKSAHKALNCLLQSSGSIVVKKWITLVYKDLIQSYGKPGWGNIWTPLSYSHDDFLLAIKNEFVEEIQKKILANISEAGRLMKLNIRLDGESKIGKSWAETH